MTVPQPVIRTVVVEPQIAKLRKKSATTTVTIELEGSDKPACVVQMLTVVVP